MKHTCINNILYVITVWCSISLYFIIQVFTETERKKERGSAIMTMGVECSSSRLVSSFFFRFFGKREEREEIYAKKYAMLIIIVANAKKNSSHPAIISSDSSSNSSWMMKRSSLVLHFLHLGVVKTHPLIAHTVERDLSLSAWLNAGVNM